MTSLDLLTIFGGIENQYLLEAQTLRSRTAPAHRLHWKRAIIMLAAVVAQARSAMTNVRMEVWIWMNSIRSRG